jgi:predicted AlkP superfamily pyrophosphatase or phosphodiesterase
VGILQRIAVSWAVVATTVMAGAAAAQEPSRAQGVITNHVVVISIDGLRPDVIEVYEARVLQRMLREGAYTLDALTVYPSKTLPSHTSMLTGVPPDVHGITWNNDQTSEYGVVSSPTIFGLARSQGLSTAAFFSKAKLRHLQQPGTLDHTVAPRGLEVFMASKTVEAATRYMRFRQPNLIFVHIAEPDAAGHSFGWLTGAYRAAVRRADAAVGQLLSAADAAYGRGNYTVLITADHGGEGRGHGTDHDNDMQIPWVAWGAGVKQGKLTGPVGTMDTAATVLWLLGIDTPPVFHGTPVTAAFTEAAQELARGR